jgi:hypothetical protein
MLKGRLIIYIIFYQQGKLDFVFLRNIGYNTISTFFALMIHVN